jgi:hypothetical protein
VNEETEVVWVPIPSGVDKNTHETVVPYLLDPVWWTPDGFAWRYEQ